MRRTEESKIQIIGIEVFTPSRCVSNEFYLNHFKQKGKDINRLLTAYGMYKRFIGTKGIDTTLSLGCNAAKKVLDKCNLTGKDIDVIIFTSQFPEVTAPTQALLLHSFINGKRECIVKDLNTNCLGMTVALDETMRFLTTSETCKRALIVGADCMSYGCRKDDEYTYPIFGDCGCALILEKDYGGCSEYLGSSYSTNSDSPDIVRYPDTGYSNDAQNRLLWTPFDGGFIPPISKELFDRTLKKTNLEMKDISFFCLSQFAKGLTFGVSDYCGIPRDKVNFIANKYGYTGTSSPFVAMYEAIKSDKIHRGDYVIIWSIATYWTSAALILKY